MCFWIRQLDGESVAAGYHVHVCRTREHGAHFLFVKSEGRYISLNAGGSIACENDLGVWCENT